MYIPLADFLAACLLLQGLNLKMELEEKKLTCSVKKSAIKANVQIMVMIIDRGSFPLGGLGVPIRRNRGWKKDR